MRTWIGRSWIRKASAIPPQAREGVVVAVGDRLVGDVPAGQHQRPAEVEASRWCSGVYGSITPEERLPGATDGGQRRVRRRRGAAGRWAAAAPVEQEARLRLADLARAAGPRSRSGAITANGLSSRCLRDRRRRDRGSSGRVGGEVVAAQALDGEDRAPPSSSAARASTGSPGGRPAARPAGAGADRRRGSTPAGRGSAGRPGRGIRRRTPAHIANPAIVVFGRS